jgi:hypothetical protein
MIGFDSVREPTAVARTLANLSIEADRRGLQKL